MQDIIEQLRQALPPIFLGSASDDLTGGAINWGTTQNKRCKGEIPDECFIAAGRAFSSSATSFLTGGRRRFRRRVPPPLSMSHQCRMRAGASVRRRRLEPCRRHA